MEGSSVLGCPRKLGSMVRINGLFHLLVNGVYWGYNPLTNHLLTSWDIQVPFHWVVSFSLKLTASLHLKMDGWNTSFLLG